MMQIGGLYFGVMMSDSKLCSNCSRAFINIDICPQCGKKLKALNLAKEASKRQGKKRDRPEERMYIAFVKEFKYRWPKLLEFLYRTEHGGYVVSPQEAKTRKATLVKGGPPDYSLYLKNKKHCSLYIEFKVDNNKQQDNQIVFERIITACGAKYVTCWSAEEGIEEVKQYLEGIE